jgi:glutaconate CoA-transferase subunit B
VTKEFILTEYFAFSSVEEVKENTGWDLKVAPDVRVVPEPTEQELANLRAVDETGMLRRKG